MIQGMTGYASTMFNNENYDVSFEIKSYNHRYLDVRFFLPDSLGMLEEEFRKIIRERCARGHIEVILKVRPVSTGDNFSVDAKIDAKRLLAVKDALMKIKEIADLSGQLTIDHLLNFEDLIIIEEGMLDPEHLRSLLLKVFNTAMDDLLESRFREGEATCRDIFAQLGRIRSGYDNIRAECPAIEDIIKNRLRSRFNDCLGNRVSEERVLTEIASLLVKHSISEELNRLAAHIEQFSMEVQSDSVGGKRLDFICQEMNREVNTIGSKNIMDTIPSHIIEMKDALENIREQLRNIE